MSSTVDVPTTEALYFTSIMDISPTNLSPRGTTGSTSDGKRKRRPTTFDGFLTSDRQFDSLITGRGATAASTGGGDRRNHDREEEEDVVSDTMPEDLTSMSSHLDSHPAKRTRQAPSSARQNSPHPHVKKVAGVQNASRKALEWLQNGDLTLLELAQALPKLSRARVEIVMEALRAAGLVSLIRKHAPDALVSSSKRFLVSTKIYHDYG